MTGAAALGKRLEEARTSASVDLGALAAAIGVSADDVRAFESGEKLLPASVLVRAASLLRVPVGTFLHEDAPTARPPSSIGSLLRTAGFAGLRPSDHLVIDRALDVARVHAELGSVLGSDNLAERYTPRRAPRSKPYLKGYEAAESVRKLIGNTTAPIRNLRLVVEDLFGVLVLFTNLSDPRVMGVAARAGNGRLVVVSALIGKETTRRFTLGHELGHILFDLGEEGAFVDEHEKGFSFDKPPHEKRADAFAAMLIAPRAGVYELLGRPSTRTPSMSDAFSMTNRGRKHFGLGFDSMAWHLKNLEYFDEATAKDLVRNGDTSPVEGFEDDVVPGVERRVRAALERECVSAGRADEIRELAAGLF